MTINGAEDAAVIGGTSTGAVTEDGSLTASGGLTITDIDSSDNPVSFNDQASTLGTNGYGNFELTAGTWTYTLNNAHASVQALDVGESLTDSYYIHGQRRFDANRNSYHQWQRRWTKRRQSTDRSNSNGKRRLQLYVRR